MESRPDPEGPAALFDEYAADYEAAVAKGLRFAGEPSSYFARERARWLRRRLDERQVVARSALDFGCGTGGAVPHLIAELGAERIVGTDVSTASLATAERDHGSAGVSFALPDALEAAAFDLANTNGVFHHIDPADRPRALALIANALRPAGLFAFWENNPWNPGTRLIMRSVEFDRDAQMISAPAARRLLAASGFE
ncbi:MAG: class I SAM-dependent methyltransferase, partial [Solirubrobacterales bacterium]